MRKEVDITIDAEGRDKGKTYHLTELSAEAAEDWLIAFGLAAARSGIILPPNWKELGLAGITTLSLQALGGMRLDEVRPLLATMFSCVQFKTSKNIVRPLTEGDIEEVSTRLRLRKEIVELHTGFFGIAARLKLEAEAKAAAESASQNTPTSLPDSQS
jgi:hypothetical protein